MLALLVGPFLVQGAALFVDETVYHRRRGSRAGIASATLSTP